MLPQHRTRHCDTSTHLPTYPHAVLWPAPYPEVEEEVVVDFVALFRRVADQFHQLLYGIQRLYRQGLGGHLLADREDGQSLHSVHVTKWTKVWERSGEVPSAGGILWWQAPQRGRTPADWWERCSASRGEASGTRPHLLSLQKQLKSIE